MPKDGNSKSRGFTLIELLVVMTIIAILLAVGTFSWVNAQQKGRDGKRKSDLKAIQQTLETYYQKNGKYPATSSGSIQCNTTNPVDNTTKIFGTDPFTCGGVNYMDKLPKDPVNQNSNGYYYSSTGSPPFRYTLSINLENDNDPDRITSGVPCAPQDYPNRDYCANNP